MWFIACERKKPSEREEAQNYEKKIQYTRFCSPGGTFQGHSALGRDTVSFSRQIPKILVSIYRNTQMWLQVSTAV
jgi:hypothetical protein